MDKLLRWLWRANPRLRAILLAKIHRLVDERTLTSPYVTAKFYPYQPSAESFQLPRVPEECGDGAGFPVPPRELWWGYAQTPEEYLIAGQAMLTKMTSVLQAAGGSLEPGQRVLDFGCASGIMIRWLLPVATAGEVWGVDISARHILFCQQHLSPPFKFATTTSFPHLPFEDGYFDLVYAGSVFTHIAELVETWLLELRRVVRQGGKLHLTVCDNTTLDILMNTDAWDHCSWKGPFRDFVEKHQLVKQGFSVFTIGRTPGGSHDGDAQVFWDREYLRRQWGNYLTILSITPEAYGIQTAVLLEK